MRLWSTLLLILQTALATNRVVVTFDTWELAARPYDVFNATIVKQYGRRMVLDMGREAHLPEGWLKELFGVNVTVELDALVMVNDVAKRDFSRSVSSNVPWNLADSEPYSIHAESTWKLTNSTPEVCVAVLDTGVARVARGAFLHLKQGYDFVSDEFISLDENGRDADPTDPGDSGPECVNPSWHGTKVMSILAADHGNAFEVLGVAQNVSVIPVRVLGQCSVGYANDITDAIVWAAGGSITGVPKNPNPAKIISMSFAGNGPCPSYLQSAINQAVGLGSFLVTAAGNDGLDTIDSNFPANCNRVLSVGASTRNGKLAAYSNRGADIAAPGGDGVDPIHVLTVQGGNLSDSYSIGTSMAVPHVAGVIALLVDVNYSRWMSFHLSNKTINDNLTIPIVRAATCSAGTYITTDPDPNQRCIACSPGKYSWEDATYCQTCPVGYISSNSATVCTDCPAGSYVHVTHMVTCQQCGTGVYSSYGAAAGCTGCLQGKYQTGIGSTACSDCPAGYYNAELSSKRGCNQCNPSEYAPVPGMTACTFCNVGEYQTGYASIKCDECPAGKYTMEQGTYSCRDCESGRYSFTGKTTCTYCAAGKYQSGYGLSTCNDCPAGKLNNRIGMDQCYNCVRGWYTSSTGVSSFCQICAEGKYASAEGLSTCTDCISQGGYNTAIGASTCISCTVCDGIFTYPYRVCTGTRDAFCCNNLVNDGYYASSCNSTSRCPVVKNGTFINSNTAKLNRCMDFACNVGYYASQRDIDRSNTTCNSTNYILNASCAPFLETVCVPFVRCTSGVSTVLRTSSGTAILEAVSNDIQCTKCVPCMPGTVQISPCTVSEQAVCAVCSTSMQYAGFPWDGRCMSYDKTPGTMTISNTPTGYYPYMLKYPVAILSSVTNNTISFPTRRVDSFTLDPNAYSMTTSPVDFKSELSVNVFIPCATPPLGWRFKAWSEFQSKWPTPVTCSSATDCANFQAPCDLVESSECLGWDDTLKQGWYASTPGECTLCPSSSTYSTCDWGLYRNVSDCRPERESGCFPCRGVLPLNAVWTASRSPHYFDESESTPCDWDCDKGFYRDGDVCKSCTKPENSVFDYGPYISFGNPNAPAKTCLTPDNCKYFGGVKGFACAWKCPNGFKLQSFPNGVLKCVACPVYSCAANEMLVFKDTCEICQRCNNVVDNAVYQPGCTFSCADGYFLLNETYCKQCTTKTCPMGQYSGGCGELSDSSCLSCSTCAVGYNVSSLCNATSDTACSQCTADLIPYSTYDSSCAVVCKSGYVMSSGQCALCAASDANCYTGQRKAAICTAQNLGCEACTAPQANNWCWSGTGPCSWDCGPRYRKLNGACIADATKTANPCIGAVFVAPTTLPETTALPLQTSPVTATATSMVTSPNTTSTVPNVTTPPVIPKIPDATTPVTRETLTVANLTMSQCLCSSSRVAAELSVLYQTTVLVVSCSTDTLTTECTNYVCPCTGSRRLLLQVDVAKYTLVYKRVLNQLKPAAITRAIRAVFPTAAVTATQSEQLGATTLDWESVMTSDTTGGVVAVVLVLAVIAGISAFVWKLRSRRNPPPPEKVIEQTIKPQGPPQTSLDLRKNQLQKMQ